MDADFGSALRSFKDYFSKYEKFVKFNPRVAAEVEAIIRWSSYLIATRKSPILGELLSSGANILQLCNDIILRQNNPQLKLDLSSCATQLKTFLSVIQSLELLAEIYGRDYYGATGKWAIVTVIQIAKAAIKLILLLVFDDGLTKTQSILPLDRIHYTEICKLQERFGDQLDNLDSDEEDRIQEVTEDGTSSKNNKSVILKSTGRKMRSISDAPPKEARFSSITSNKEQQGSFTAVQKQRLTILLDRYREHKSAVLTERQLYGELLHIARPIAHLALMGAFGTKSWISYITSLAMDVSSLYLVRSLPIPMPQGVSMTATMSQQTIPKCYHFNLNERMELGQRASSLLLYLLRSPFFDDYTKQRALQGIATTAENIPLFGSFIATFINYIPDWQKDYFRVWSD